MLKPWLGYSIGFGTILLFLTARFLWDWYHVREVVAQRGGEAIRVRLTFFEEGPFRTGRGDWGWRATFERDGQPRTAWVCTRPFTETAYQEDRV